MQFNPLGLIGWRQGLLGWFTPQAPAATSIPARPAGDMQTVRHAMLEAMIAADISRNTRLAVRIRYCGTPQALWDLRGELMVAMAAAIGEARAREEMAHITQLFDGLVPAGLTSRPAPLR